MKLLSKLKVITAIIAFVSLTLSCNNDDVKTEVDLTTMGVIKGNPIFSQLVKAIELTGLSETLKSSEPHTLFAFGDETFNAFLEANSYKSINEVPKEILKQIVLNHVLKDKVSFKDFTTGYVKTLATATNSGGNNLSMYVDVTAGVVLNGVSKIIYDDFKATNGVVHIVDKLIFLPTVVTHAKANPNFKSLVDNLVKITDPNLATTLSGSGPFTVFAPTNAAFTAFNTELAPGGLNGVSIANLEKVLKYHVTNGNLLAASLSENQVIATLQTPQNFSIQLAGGAKIKDVKNRISTIEVTDIQCWNGVIHVVNKVLLPNL